MSVYIGYTEHYESLCVIKPPIYGSPTRFQLIGPFSDAAQWQHDEDAGRL
jgi:hypothetical protein